MATITLKNVTNGWSYQRDSNEEQTYYAVPVQITSNPTSGLIKFTIGGSVGGEKLLFNSGSDTITIDGATLTGTHAQKVASIKSTLVFKVANSGSGGSGDSTAATLTNKSISGSTNTLTNIKQSSIAVANVFNVKDYGATGNGTADDTAAFQSAITACIAARGVLDIPTPSNYWKITSTLNIIPVSGQAETYINIKCGPRSTIKYSGANDTVCFNVIGLTGCIWDNIQMELLGSQTGRVLIDLDTSSTAGSLHFNQFNNHILVVGVGLNSRGYRLGHVSGGGADISCLSWVNCTVANNTGTHYAGQIGWHNEGSNSLQNNLFGCFAFGLEKGFSNKEYTGATQVGNGSFYFYGFGASDNNTDFEIQNISNIHISGGRFENGKCFLRVLFNNKSSIISIEGVEIDNYTPSDGRLVYTEMPCGITLDNVTIRSPYNTPYTSNMIKLGGGQYGGSIGAGRLIVRGGLIDATDPFYSLDNSTVWKVYIQGVAKADADGVATTTFTDTPSIPTGGASVVTLASDVTNNNATANTLSDVTGLQFAVVSGKSYKFKATITFRTNAGQPGTRWAINGPSTSSLVYDVSTQINGNAKTFSYNNNSYNGGAVTGNSPGDFPSLAIIEGTLTASASGVVVVRFSSGTSSSAVTAKAGLSVIEYFTTN